LPLRASSSETITKAEDCRKAAINITYNFPSMDAAKNCLIFAIGRWPARAAYKHTSDTASKSVS
jgi:hypothetical protein